MKDFISIVVPVYRCEKCLKNLNLLIEKIFQENKLTYELILVNDASPENDWNIIKTICQNYPNVIGINLSRNFGQQYAIAAGIEHAKGNWVVVMDCDLQDKPSEIIKLYNKAISGFDVVLARRTNKKYGFLKKILSKYFYKILAYLTDTEQDSLIGNFGIYHKKVIKSVLSMHDYNRYFPTMIRWVGFKQTAIDVSHAERDVGKSSYSLKKLMNLALDVILAFSDKPLKITVKFGFLISFASIIFALIYLTKYLTGNIEVRGFTTLIITIWFLAGVVISVLGIIGLYIGKIFEKVKQRPTFIVQNIINYNKTNNEDSQKEP